METTIRKGSSPFYGDTVFSRGLSVSGYFNIRESEELKTYGFTLQGLSDGSLLPSNDEETRFVADITTGSDSGLYAVKLWNKYLTALKQSRSGYSATTSANCRYQPSDFSLDMM